MTEEQWLACTDQFTMLAFVWARKRLARSFDRRQQKAHQRKLRLYICACCRSDWDHFTERGRFAVGIAERYADGLVTRQQLRAAWKDAEAAAVGERGNGTWWARLQDRLWGPAWDDDSLEPVAASAAKEHIELEDCQSALLSLGWLKKPNLLHELFGNPFRIIVPIPAWLAWSDGTIPKLAQAIYDERAFDRLPILADALEDAGCTNADLLGHLRGPGPHYCGCCALDLLLGKE